MTTGDAGRSPLVIALPGNEVFTERLASAANGECGQVAMREFPDGETYVRLESDPRNRDVVLVSTLRHPNDKILPLIFLADLTRELGASRVGLVAPYLAYMRQDARFHAGEAVTSRSFAELLSRAVDWLLTLDPHLHRVARLRELYSIPATAIHVATDLGTWIAAHVRSPLIIGPDEESRQWAEVIATAAHAPFIVLRKIRHGDAEVSESPIDLGEHRACTPVLVDDIISTGHTMIAAVQQLRSQSAAPPECVAVHAVFSEGAYEALQSAGAARVVTTNTIAHMSNCIDVTPVVAAALREQLGLAS